MGDTSYFVGGKEVTIYRDNSNNSGGDTLLTNTINNLQKANNETELINYEPYLFFIVLAIFVTIEIKAVFRSKDKNYTPKSSFGRNKQYKNNINKALRKNTQVSNDYFLYDGKELNLAHTEIKNILATYFVYYRNLEIDLQNKFYERLVQFMHHKQFLIYADEPFKEMPVLISAAAVQISFGLSDFKLPHYQHIRVKKQEYFAENSLRILAGNVQENAITLAWNQLLKGYENYEDGSNVGLHEMAHALYFQEMIVANEQDEFATHFNNLMTKGEIVLQQKQCPHNLYSSYAFTNLQEFWAVSVELFFEKANHLYQAYPQVYKHLQDLLKQNPLMPNKPI